MSYDLIREDVPGFIQRVGDHVIRGSNNTIAIFGTDRHGDINSGLGGPGTGAIHFIAGRKNSNGDPDFDKDDSFLYLARKTNVDKNLSLESVENASNSLAAGVLKSDAVRIVARKDLKITMADGAGYLYLSSESCVVNLANKKKITITKEKIRIDSGQKTYIEIKDDLVLIHSADKIQLGENASNHLLKFETMQKLYDNHTHATPSGASGPPASLMAPGKDTLSTSSGPEILVP